MDNIYVNDFDRATFKYVSTPGVKEPVKEVYTLLPIVDSGVLVSETIGAQVIYTKIPVGPLFVGASVPPPVGVVTTVPDSVVIQGNVPQSVVGYTTVTVPMNHNAVGQAQSQAFYFLPGYELFSIDATVTFDLPLGTSDAMGTEDHSANKWAVTVVLKTGNQFELPSDTRIFASVQFKSGGVYLPAHSSTIPVDVNSFAAYASQGTQFQLSLSILPGALSATETLTFGTKTASGPIAFTAANLAAVTAIGVSIVNPTDAIYQIGARLKSFTITAATGKARSAPSHS